MDAHEKKVEESNNLTPSLQNLSILEVGSLQNLSILEEYVKHLYEYRDRYFDHHTIAEAYLKDERVNVKKEETLKLLKAFDCGSLKVEDRAKFYYLLGRTHDVGELHSPEGEAALAKAVKLDPQLVEAWNQLGECYWKRGNFKEAKNCFQGALNKKKNIVSLRNLSILVRQEPSTSQEKIKNVELGLDLAKQAVEMDAGDPESWLVLGNAFLAVFFNVQQNPRTLKQAMTAYSRAEADPRGKNNHDLHYNKAVAHKYEEDYPSALREFSRASELNPSWETPRKMVQQLLQYLDSTADLLRANGRLRGKKLQALLQNIEDKQLGPYEGGEYKGPGGQTVKLTLQPLSSLKSDINCKVVVLGKVICSVHNEDSVPFTFCLIDRHKSVCAVTVYNIAEGQGVIIGDSVAIPEPYVTNVSFSYGSRKYSFKSIRVDNPLVMVVNGKKLGKDKLAGTKMSTLPLTH